MAKYTKFIAAFSLVAASLHGTHIFRRLRQSITF